MKYTGMPWDIWTLITPLFREQCREEKTRNAFRCRHSGYRFDIYILYRRTIIMKKLGLFAVGVLFGTAGIKLLGSRDAKKVYAHTTAAALRAKEGEVVDLVGRVGL